MHLSQIFKIQIMGKERKLPYNHNVIDDCTKNTLVQSRKKVQKRHCLSQHKKYIITVSTFPVTVILLFSAFIFYDLSRLIVLFFIILGAPVIIALIILPNFIKCPQCAQEIGCGKHNCMDWIGLNRIGALFEKKCKKCGYNLDKCPQLEGSGDNT